jgi:hypothetical protein
LKCLHVFALCGDAIWLQKTINEKCDVCNKSDLKTMRKRSKIKITTTLFMEM